jgi:hypothetical protein
LNPGCRGGKLGTNHLSYGAAHILSLMLFVLDNQNNFYLGLEVHALNIRSQNQLYLPISNLSVWHHVYWF